MVAEIMIWGELAGAVRWDERQQLANFQYHPDFLRKGRLQVGVVVF